MSDEVENAELVSGAVIAPGGAAVAVSSVTRFVARDTFRLQRGGAVPISLIGEDFARHFLDLVEEEVPAATLQAYLLLQGTIDRPIFDALGGEIGARVALAHLHAFLATADRAHWYFFYVADVAGKLWAIDTYWRDSGWDLEAYSITYPRGWRRGGRVVSHGRMREPS